MHFDVLLQKRIAPSAALLYCLPLFSARSDMLLPPFVSLSQDHGLQNEKGLYTLIFDTFSGWVLFPICMAEIRSAVFDCFFFCSSLRLAMRETTSVNNMFYIVGRLLTLFQSLLFPLSSLAAVTDRSGTCESAPDGWQAE
jgi:hypothetical protein